jgi:hypothetical protein
MKLRTVEIRFSSVWSSSGFLLYFLARSFAFLLSDMYSNMSMKAPMARPTRAPWIAVVLRAVEVAGDGRVDRAEDRLGQVRKDDREGEREDAPVRDGGRPGAGAVR